MTALVDLLAEFERKYRRPKPGRTLIVGSHIYGGKEDRRKLYPLVTGVDMIDGPGVDVVCDMEDWSSVMLSLTDGDVECFDHIECRSVLEHSERPWLMARNIECLLAPGGTLDITVPFVWRVHGYPSDYWRLSAEAVRSLFPSMRWRAVVYANNKLSKRFSADRQTIGGVPHFPRTEVFAFGAKAE